MMLMGGWTMCEIQILLLFATIMITMGTYLRKVNKQNGDYESLKYWKNAMDSFTFQQFFNSFFRDILLL
ncbi:hypothetical protein AMQ83_16640 [Paenibacillus riograndensis]|nr:hypothetical protein AMQ83_16640 [Paenibacillus riograndensis]